MSTAEQTNRTVCFKWAETRRNAHNVHTHAHSNLIVRVQCPYHVHTELQSLTYQSSAHETTIFKTLNIAYLLSANVYLTETYMFMS